MMVILLRFSACIALFYLLLSLSAAPVQGQSAADETGYWLEDEAFIPTARQAIQLIYNQEPEASRAVLSPWLEQQPEHPLGHFWNGLELWWYILADLENETYDEAFIRHLENADRAADRLLRKNRRHYDALVLKSLSNAFLARMHANRESWYSAFRHGRVAFNILQNTVQIYPEISADAAFGFGLYSYFTAYIKDEYSLVKAVSWMLPAGDRALGLERLQEAAENGVFVKPEAAYFLGHINLHYEKAPDRAETYLTELQENHPRNSFFNRLLLRTYFQQNRQAEATRLNEELLQRYEARAETLSTEQASSSLTEQARRNAVLATLEELYTIRGQLFYQEFNYDEAILAFQEVLSLQPQLTGGAARRHQRIAAYKLGRSYVRQSNKEAAIPYFEALANADSDDGLRELAEAELRRIKE